MANTMKQQIKRVVLSGDKEAVKFDFPSGEYQVINFGEDIVYASFDEDATEENSNKIEGRHARTVFGNTYAGSIDLNSMTDTIYLTGSGEVEVQQVWHR